MAVGAPIPVPKIAPGQPGYADAVDDAHSQLVKALVDLYEKYRGQYGWHDRELVVT
jgi:2-acylglycerol O-acyltransferase 2